MDTAWLAGLLEGEGCFRWDNRTPRIMLRMTDKDIVSRAAALLGSKCLGPYLKKNKKHKPAYQTDLGGIVAYNWMKSLLPFMGIRRSTKIKEVIAIFDKQHWSKQDWQHFSTKRERKANGTWCKGTCKPEGRYGVEKEKKGRKK